MRDARSALILLSALVCGCTASALAAPSAAFSITEPHAGIGDFGLDLSARKLSVKPGDDFYTYANGTWFDSFVIPPDRSFYGSFTKLVELCEQRVRDLTESA